MKKQRLLVAVFASMALAGWSGDAEIIVESYSDGLNSQAFTKPTGKWNESTAKSTAPGVQATKTVYNDANADAGTARFTPDIPVAGKYEVFMTYPIQGNATDVKYTVVSADGSKDVALTQNGRKAGVKPAANEWTSLGVFSFAAGTAGYVEISDPLTGAKPLPNEPNARIYADALKFVPQGFSLPADYANKGAKPGVTAPVIALATTPAAPATGMPALPGTGAAAALPSLPGAATPTAGAGLPALPPSTADAAPGLPALPSTPAAGAAAQLPGLPASTPETAALPALPATPAMPALPAATPDVAALPALPPAPSAGAVAQTTPIPTPNLPSLAPVTPTPQRRIPSPSDTPVAGMPTGLPNGALSNLPPMPGPGMPELPTGPASPTLPAIPAVPVSPVMPGMAPTPAAVTAAATPAPASAANLSITQYNPSGLQWMYDFGAALNTARAQNKKVMIFFTASGNQIANTYETQYFMHPAVRQALNNYVLVKVDFPKNTRLGYTLGIFGAGIIVVTDGTGNVTSRIEQIPATPTDLIKLMAVDKPVKAAATPAAGAAPAVAVTTTTSTATTTGTM